MIFHKEHARVTLNCWEFPLPGVFFIIFHLGKTFLCLQSLFKCHLPKLKLVTLLIPTWAIITLLIQFIYFSIGFITFSYILSHVLFIKFVVYYLSFPLDHKPPRVDLYLFYMLMCLNCLAHSRLSINVYRIMNKWCHLSVKLNRTLEIQNTTNCHSILKYQLKKT